MGGVSKTKRRFRTSCLFRLSILNMADKNEKVCVKIYCTFVHEIDHPSNISSYLQA